MIPAPLSTTLVPHNAGYGRNYQLEQNKKQQQRFDQRKNTRRAQSPPLIPIGVQFTWLLNPLRTTVTHS